MTEDVVESTGEPDPTPSYRTPAVAPLERPLLALEVVYMYARVRWLLLRRGPVAAVGVLRGDIPEPAAGEVESTRFRRDLRFGRAVVKVLRFVPTDSRCLMRSLVLTGMLARRGVYATVVIGVRPGPEFGAHAWVEVGGCALLATGEATFTRLAEI